MDNVTRLLMQGTAGASGDKTYVDDVFSTYLYNGNSGTQTITNGIDFAGEGGMVWCKTRGSGTHYEMSDTERGTATGNNGGRVIKSNETDAQSMGDNGHGFTSSGFTLGFVSGDVNWSPRPSVSWSFRKSKGFFDVITYTGNGSARTIAHSLGSVPGMIFVKRTSAARQWCVWHRNLTDNGRYLILNSNYTQQGYSGNTDRWNNQNPTATHLNIGTNDDVNENGASYVAYIFAHDEQSYGENGDQSIIKCGSYTGNGSESNGTVVNLGWEPQWLLVKRLTGQEHWGIVDVMRGWFANGQANILQPNRINAEDTNANSALPTSTGFKLHTTNAEWNGNTETYIYMAIRRPDGLVAKPAEAGTDVFAMDTGNGSTDGPAFDSGFPVDMGLRRLPATGNDGTPSTDWATYSRSLGGVFLRANETNVEQTSSRAKWDLMTGFNHTDNSTFQAWMWKRHAGFDVVTYDGNSTPGRTVQHNLSKIPEMIWIKCRNTAESWVVGHKGLNSGTNPWEYSLRLNDNHAETDYPYFNDTAPTSTLFTLNNNGQVNGTGTNEYVAFLFASIEGISKVGSYTGNGQTGSYGPFITTGFSPRFIIVKRVDSNAGFAWNVHDTTRGIDNRLRLQSTAAQATLAAFDLSSTGFRVKTDNASYNASSGRYIYYAHA